jgi:hypothetical protein
MSISIVQEQRLQFLLWLLLLQSHSDFCCCCSTKYSLSEAELIQLCGG